MVGVCTPLAGTIIHDISKQIEQRTHIGKIFARWYLAIAITSFIIKYLPIDTSRAS